MRSSTGEYFQGLDHVRAVAVFLVFCWHFLHVNNGQIDPLPGTFDFFAFSIFAEGHTGVSLFMVLSGYLFAKLTQGKQINYRRFLLARAIRLLPLLIAVCLLVSVKTFVLDGTGAGLEMLERIAWGSILPTLPNGGWSITAEVHFYLLFPLIILLERRLRFGALVFVLVALSVRVGTAISDFGTDVRGLAYPTIVGRIDQFVIGILFAYHGTTLARRHVLAGIAALALLSGYAVFDRIGGFYGNHDYANIWIINLTLEALLYGVLIAWYDQSFHFDGGWLSALIAKVGEASYSIYLLHFFFVFTMASLIDQHLMRIDSIYKGLFFSLVAFIPVAVIGWYSYALFERYWLRFRPIYADRAGDSERGQGQ